MVADGRQFAMIRLSLGNFSHDIQRPDHFEPFRRRNQAFQFKEIVHFKAEPSFYKSYYPVRT